jgi:hypothetical protein
LFLNGALVQTATLADQDAATTNPVFIAAQNFSGFPNYLNGYISNLRIVKGTAVYTSNFTPPTSPVTAISGTSLLLNFTNAGIYDAATLNDLVAVDNVQVSTAQAKFGSSSMVFDGTGDYLQFPENGSLDFGTGNFTVEAWVNMNTFVSDRGSIAGDLGPTNGGWMFAIRGASQISWGRSQIAWDVSTSGFTMSTGTWYHVAACRSGTSFKIFINGTAYATATNSTAYNMINNFFAVGARQVSTGSFGPGEYFNGYMEDLRITKGYARYTANFTPPTAPFPTR